MLVNLLLYAGAFTLIWFGAGLIVSSVNKFSKRLRLSPFAFSFVFLALLTQAPEFSIGLQAVADKNSQIFIGNLLGGTLVLFLLVIPLLAIFGNGISLKYELGKKTLLTTLLVILAPAAVVLDRRISILEGIGLILAYLFLLFVIQRKHGLLDASNEKLLDIKAYSYRDILKIIVGIGLVFAASSLIVDKTIYFADILKIPAFYVSLLVVAIGTDLPELTLAIKSAITGKKDIAMGDYIGGAAASTLLFGIFTLLSAGEIVTVSNFFVTFIFIAIALLIFYFLSRTEHYISRANGLLLVGIYILFVIFELYLK